MITIPYGKTHIPYDFPYDGLLTSRVDQLSSSKSGLELVEEAMAAARALQQNTDLSAHEIAEKALHIAADICVYTNHNVIVEDV